MGIRQYLARNPSPGHIITRCSWLQDLALTITFLRRWKYIVTVRPTGAVPVHRCRATLRIIIIVLGLGGLVYGYIDYDAPGTGLESDTALS